MKKIWKVSEPMIFHEIGENFFVITFENSGDNKIVLGGHPWLFDNYLFVLRSFDGTTQPHLMNFSYESFWTQMHNIPLGCMNRQMGEQIRGTIGKVMGVDAQEDEMACGQIIHDKKECSGGDS